MPRLSQEAASHQQIQHRPAHVLLEIPQPHRLPEGHGQPRHLGELRADTLRQGLSNLINRSDLPNPINLFTPINPLCSLSHRHTP